MDRSIRSRASRYSICLSKLLLYICIYSDNNNKKSGATNMEGMIVMLLWRQQQPIIWHTFYNREFYNAFHVVKWAIIMLRLRSVFDTIC